MTDLPQDMLNRSKTHGERANTYGRRVDTELSGSERAKRQSDIGWDRNLTMAELDNFLGQTRVGLACLGLLALGFTLVLWSIFNQQSAAFILGTPMTILGGLTTYYNGVKLKTKQQTDQALLHHNLSVDMAREQAINQLRATFSDSEIRILAVESNVSFSEMQLALLVASGLSEQQAREAQQTWAYTQDLRDKDHELSIKDKDILLERAKGEVSVSEWNAKAEASRQEIRLRHDLAILTAKEDLFIEQQRFVREMTRLDKEHTQAARLQKINEVTQLRKVLIATHAELRNNPALTDQLRTIISEVDLLLAATQSREPMTPEDYQRQELIDQMLTRLLLQRHGMGDEPSAA